MISCVMTVKMTVTSQEKIYDLKYIFTPYLIFSTSISDKCASQILREEEIYFVGTHLTGILGCVIARFGGHNDNISPFYSGYVCLWFYLYC